MSNAIQKADPHQGQVVPINDNGALMAAIANAARDPNIDVEKMERLFAMHERMEAKQAETAFNTAMNEAQNGMGRISADRENTQTRSWYASYGALDRVLRPIYTQHGFALSFDTGDSPPDMVRVLCRVSHSAGHTQTYHADMPADGKGAKGGDVMTKTHAAGSAMSYGMRYLLKMIFNVALGEDDDDGNGAGEPLPRITADQAATIRDMLDVTGSDTRKFLNWLKADSIEAIAAQAYEAAIKALKAKEKSA